MPVPVLLQVLLEGVRRLAEVVVRDLREEEVVHQVAVTSPSKPRAARGPDQRSRFLERLLCNTRSLALPHHRSPTQGGSAP